MAQEGCSALCSVRSIISMFGPVYLRIVQYASVSARISMLSKTNYVSVWASISQNAPICFSMYQQGPICSVRPFITLFGPLCLRMTQEGCSTVCLVRPFIPLFGSLYIRMTQEECSALCSVRLIISTFDPVYLRIVQYASVSTRISILSKTDYVSV